MSLMLLDTASLYFRAFYAVPTSITAPDGTPVNAVRGFCDMLARFVTRWRPDDLVACRDDDWRPAWRVEAIPTYKTHRVAEVDPEEEEVDDQLSPQVPLLYDLLEAFGVATAGAEGYEADDIIGTFVARDRTLPRPRARFRVGAAPWRIGIVTGDRDLFQLVDDERQVVVVSTMRGMQNLEVVDEASVYTRYGVPAALYPEFAALRGDPSDGLPGVPGVGEKTAARLLATFGSLEGVLQAAEDKAEGLTPTLRGRLQDSAEYLTAALRVTRVATNAPLPEVDLSCPRQPADPSRLEELAHDWGLTSPVQRLTEAFAG
jgi:5'-3' exonuclease